jgi:hypothetical protein
VTWNWTRGAGTLKVDFGNPLTATNYAFCIYDRAQGTPELKLVADIPPGGTCGHKSCWTATRHGFKYSDRSASADGVTSLVLTEGLEGFAQIRFKAAGVNLAMPPLPLDQDPTVTAQLRNSSGFCWDADYSAPATANDSAEFRDRSN